MKSGKDILYQRAADAGIVLGGSIPFPVFAQLGLPPIVACTGCGTTMVLPACMVDDDNQCWCRNCSGQEEDGDG